MKCSYFDSRKPYARMLWSCWGTPGTLVSPSTASCRQSRRLLQCVEDNFLIQATDSLTRGEVLLDLLLTNMEELIGDEKIGGSLGCSSHALVEFSLEQYGPKEERVRILNFRKANFHLFKELVDGTALGNRPHG